MREKDTRNWRWMEWGNVWVLRAGSVSDEKNQWWFYPSLTLPARKRVSMYFNDSHQTISHHREFQSAGLQFAAVGGDGFDAQAIIAARFDEAQMACDIFAGVVIVRLLVVPPPWVVVGRLCGCWSGCRCGGCGRRGDEVSDDEVGLGAAQTGDQVVAGFR